MARVNEPQSKGLQSVFKGSKQDFKNLKGTLSLMLAFQEMLLSSTFKSKICKGPFVQSVANMFRICGPGTENLADRDHVVEEFRKCLFLATEAMSSSEKILINQHQPIITYLLPVLIDKIDENPSDIRFFALKTFTDFIT